VILSGILFALTASPEPAYDYFPYDSFVGPGDSTNKKDSLAQDSLNLRYPIQDNPLYGDKPVNNLDFEDPAVIRTETYFDTTDGTYKTRQVVGGSEYRPTETKSFDEYLKEVEKKETQNYFRQRSNANSFVRGGGLIPTIKVGPKVFDKIFGGGTIDVRPQGSAELTFGWNYNVVRNPAFTARQQRNGQFDFKQKIKPTEKHILVIDTQGTIENYPNYNSYILATKNAVVYPSKSSSNRVGETSVFYFRNLKKDFTLNKNIYNNFLNVIRPYSNKALYFLDYFVIIFLFFFFIFGSFFWTTGIMFGLVFLTFFVWIINLIFKKGLSYSSLYKIGMHAVTWPILISEISHYLKSPYPTFYSLIFFIWMMLILFSTKKKT